MQSQDRTPCTNCEKHNHGTQHLVMEQNMQTISLIQELVSPKTISSNDNKCKFCLDLALSIKLEPPDTEYDTIECSVIDIPDNLDIKADPLCLEDIKPDPLQLDHEYTESNTIDKTNQNSTKRLKLDKQNIEEECSTSNKHTEKNNVSEVNTMKEQQPNTDDCKERIIREKEALKKGCKLCGRSVLTRKSMVIKQEQISEINKLTSKLICETATEEVTKYDRVCNNCWRRLKKKVQITLLTNTEAIKIVTNGSQSVSNDTPQRSPTSVKSAEPNTWIELPNYRRSPNTSRVCLFPSCQRPERNRPKDLLRIEVLINHNFYVPAHARICSYHLLRNNWEGLFEHSQSISTFTQEYIEDIFALLKASQSQVNFNDVLSIDENLLQYWIGMTRQRFIELVNELPEIKDMPRGLTGLACLLIIRHRGDTNKKLSNLTDLSHATLSRLIHSVNEHLALRGDILDVFMPPQNNLKTNKKEVKKKKCDASKHVKPYQQTQPQ